MKAEFTPFAAMGPIDGTEMDEFAPVTVEEAPTIANRPPPEKALADLEDALGMGLDDETLQGFVDAASGSMKTPASAFPLTLRDFSGPRTEPGQTPDGRVPSILVTRAGEIVQKVTVECPCGERISLDCVY
jgi:hypothetical protein